MRPLLFLSPADADNNDEDDDDGDDDVEVVFGISTCRHNFVFRLWRRYGALFKTFFDLLKTQNPIFATCITLI